MVNTCDKCLKKLTVRNFITISTIIVFLSLVIYTVLYNPNVLENPLITFMLGTFVSAVTMIYTFYYRKNPSNEKFIYDEKPDSGICPCCGQKIPIE